MKFYTEDLKYEQIDGIWHETTLYKFLGLIPYKKETVPIYGDFGKHLQDRLHGIFKDMPKDKNGNFK